MGIQFPFARVEYCDDAKTEVFREITNKNNVVVALQVILQSYSTSSSRNNLVNLSAFS